jgi:hypothetical protein
MIQLYDWLQKGIKPWEWDFESYGEGNEDMIGYFYPEDIENIKGIDEYINKREIPK